MDIDELIYLLNNQVLNSKCNNYIFTGLTSEEIKVILDSILDESTINKTYDFYDECSNNKIKNIKIDFNKIKPNNIVNTILEELKLENRLDINKKVDLLKFRGILRKNNINVQLIMYNLDMISKDEQERINDMISFRNSFCNIVVLLKEDHLITYKTTVGDMLDGREDYQQEKVTSYKKLFLNKH